MSYGLMLRQLIQLAEQEQHALSTESWDEAVTLRIAFDHAFTQLQRQVEETPLTPAESNELTRLHHLHERNITLARELQTVAGDALTAINKVVPLLSYSPAGTGKPAPRYLDESA